MCAPRLEVSVSFTDEEEDVMREKDIPRIRVNWETFTILQKAFHGQKTFLSTMLNIHGSPALR